MPRGDKSGKKKNPNNRYKAIDFLCNPKRLEFPPCPWYDPPSNKQLIAVLVMSALRGVPEVRHAVSSTRINLRGQSEKEHQFIHQTFDEPYQATPSNSIMVANVKFLDFLESLGYILDDFDYPTPQNAFNKKFLVSVKEYAERLDFWRGTKGSVVFVDEILDANESGKDLIFDYPLPPLKGPKSNDAPLKWSDAEDAFVYVLYSLNDDQYKIGTTEKDPFARMGELGNGRPHLSLYACFKGHYAKETRTHKELERYSLGREAFRGSAKDKIDQIVLRNKGKSFDWLAALAASIEKNPKMLNCPVFKSKYESELDRRKVDFP